MSNLTFLTQEQCFESEKLDILQKRGTKAAITDFSILLGGWVDDRDTNYFHIDGDDSLEGRVGCYWTKSNYREMHIDRDNKVFTVDAYGDCSLIRVEVRGCGARPALPFSSIFSIPTNGASGAPKLISGQF